MRKSWWSAALLAVCIAADAEAVERATAPVESVVGPGWANNSVNAVVFRKNSLVSDRHTQYVGYYDAERYLVLGKRKLGTSRWTTRRTPYRGNAADAHNAISLMLDGAGYLHVSWDHHNNALRYARGVKPGSLELGAKLAMVGADEESVSYPEFYRLPDGNLLFFYRLGGSGRGDLVINRYDAQTRRWSRLHTNLITGEGRRNAYWQAFLDHRGTLHLSWVWRESPDVASNHDLAYARSRDGGVTWETSAGRPYALPISADSAEYALRIPQNSELINQTSMAADSDGHPYIASYWRDAGSAVPQYHVVFHDGDGWTVRPFDFRKTAFSLSGEGTKRIPIARPQIMVDAGPGTGKPGGLLVFRDEERGSKVSVVSISDFVGGKWQVGDLTAASVGAWEPSFDTELWRRNGMLSLFVQDVQQVDGEGQAAAPPRPVRVLDWRPR
ncbi:BNR repeat-containing protein [Duganella sp. CF517]|uniref:BNR repeat-containing protein n=1 Tax=Duganella sp. CF517 TaxID=1881038 RepID=UPI000B7F0202|nr:BNR repeat-containing protein [Duganella sp. CF517]